uniref:Uncharacterized protein n=1 Tax=Tetranychus urticae TaxID=32264 RepID=T1KXZ9_TETUR
MHFIFCKMMTLIKWTKSRLIKNNWQLEIG